MPTQPARRTARQSSRTIQVILVSVLATGGCALPTRIKTVDLSVPSVAEPAAGPAVTIVAVTDSRHVPAGDLEKRKSRDPNIAARAYGAKGVGLTAGVIVLPEGRTVAHVVEEAVAEGLRQAGYIVLAEGDPGISEAIPVKVDIRKFWTWKDNETHFDATVVVGAPVGVLAEPRWISSTVTVKPRSYATLWLVRLDTFGEARKKGVKRLIEKVVLVAGPSIEDRPTTIAADPEH